MPGSSGLTKKENTKFCNIQIVDACNFPKMFCKVSCMWSELTDNKPHCVYTDFDQKVVEESNQSPCLISHHLLNKEWCCLSGSPIAKDYVPKPKQKKKKKGLTNEDEEKIWAFLSLYSQGNSSLDSRKCGLCRWLLFWSERSETQTNHHLHFYCCPNHAT